MNTPNPLIPQGTFPDNRGRSHIRIAIFTILAVHIVLLGALLMAGCKKTSEDTGEGKALTNAYAPISLPPDTNPPIVIPTNPPPVVVVAPSNPPVVMPVTPPPPEVTTLTTTEHVVVKGDSFYTIGKKYGVTMKAVGEANAGVDSSRLKIGQKLKIPAPSAAAAPGGLHVASTGNGISAGTAKTYTVKSGDNLMKIAKANGTSIKALRAANSLKTDQIKVGQKLKIPSKVSVPAPESVSTGAVPVGPNP